MVAVDNIEHPDGRLPDEPQVTVKSAEEIQEETSSLGATLDGEKNLGTETGLWNDGSKPTAATMGEGLSDEEAEKQAAAILREVNGETARVETEITEEKPEIEKNQTEPASDLGDTLPEIIEGGDSQFTASSKTPPAETVMAKPADSELIEAAKAKAEPEVEETVVEEPAKIKEETLAERIENISPEENHKETTIEKIDDVIAHLDKSYDESMARTESLSHELEEGEKARKDADAECDRIIAEQQKQKERNEMALQEIANRITPALQREDEFRKKTAEHKKGLVEMRQQISSEDSLDLTA